MSPLIWAGRVDVLGDIREVQIPADTADKARALGWMVLDDALCAVPAHVRTRPDATGHSGPEDDDDDGA